MSKSVLISIKPEWCEKIVSGEKTIEARKSKPKLDVPFKCYIYETGGDQRVGNQNFNVHVKGGGRKKVIGEFVCDRLVWVVSHPSIFAGHPLLHKAAIDAACLTNDEAEEYSAGKDVYGWHISDLVIYDKPRELSEFSSGSSRLEFSDTEDGFPLKWSGMTRPPMSWCYVEEISGK